MSSSRSFGVLHDIDIIRMRLHPIDECYLAAERLDANDVDVYGVDWGHLPVVERYHTGIEKAADEGPIRYRTGRSGLLAVYAAGGSADLARLVSATVSASGHTCGSCGRHGAVLRSQFRLVLCSGCAKVRTAVHKQMGVPADFRWVPEDLDMAEAHPASEDDRDQKHHER